MRFALLRVAALVSALTVLLAVAPAASAQTAGWNPGPGAILDITYDGYIDVPGGGATVPGGGSFTVAGWFVDKTAQGWAGADDVQVWLGTMDGGGRMLAKAIFAQSRPDVGGATGNPFWSASGFGAAVAGSSVPSGSQTLNVYAHTPGKGWWYKSVSVSGGGAGTGTAAPSAPAVTAGTPTTTVSTPTNNENVSTKSDYIIQGVASANVDMIQIFINGERGGNYSSELGIATPGGDGSWSLTFKPTKYPSMHSNVYIYAHGRNGQETIVVREINIVDK
jgi:hypothetical protein